MSEKLQKREPYRPISVPEKDLLFAMYDKHNGNMLSMTRDRECLFKGYNQIRYYADLYNFEPRLVEIRRKRAKKTLDSLKDSKILTIQQAIRMVETHQIPLKNKQGEVILDADGQPMFYEVDPNHKEIKTAWEIIKTELGEPTSIAKHKQESQSDLRIFFGLNDEEAEVHESIFKRDDKQTTNDNIKTSDGGGSKNPEAVTQGGAYETR
jgi:hypothetical protein